MAGIPTLKNGIHYLEHCRIHARDGRLTYTRDQSGVSKHFAIPHANRVYLLLGPGTSVSQEAARKMSDENMQYGYTAGGGTPIFMASLNEYRPTEYFLGYMQRWQDDAFRLEAAKYWQRQRIQKGIKLIAKIAGRPIDVTPASDEFLARLETAQSIEAILGYEANYIKKLYRAHAIAFDVNFSRDPQSNDELNKRLTQGNYLAYGYASVALWTLGIPATMPLIHGKTRRGGLVFDLADIFKSAVILPSVFRCAKEDLDDSSARAQIIIDLDDHKALEGMFTLMKNVACGELA